MAETEYDPHNDAFVFRRCCPYPDCGATIAREPDQSPAVYLCESCMRLCELVRLAGDGQGAWVARRPRSAFCTRTGRRLHEPSSLDWTGAGGSPQHNGCFADTAGYIFGTATRQVVWSIETHWTQNKWGLDDRERLDETVTSISVFRGIVCVVSARGRVGFFDAETGKPMLRRPLEWQWPELDEHYRATAVRLAPVLQGTTLVMVADRMATVRDIAPSLYPQLQGAAGVYADLAPSTGKQWIGPPMLIGDEELVVLLVEGIPQGPQLPPAQVVLRFFTTDGTPCGSCAAPDLVRPPVVDPSTQRVFWVSHLGHVWSLPTSIITQVSQHVSADDDSNDGGVMGAAQAKKRERRAQERDEILSRAVQCFMPMPMLDLVPTERAHLLLSESMQGERELWLLDDQSGDVRVWRAPLRRIMDENSNWAWEGRLDYRGLGDVRGFAVGISSRGRDAVVGRYYAVSTAQSTSLFDRSAKDAAPVAVLGREPLVSPVLTPIGVFTQDREGLWLRGLPQHWSYSLDNPEILLSPFDREPPSLYDRTLAVFGRQIFFSSGGRICSARLKPAWAEGRSHVV